MDGKFDPIKSGLLGYLKRAAERDLIVFAGRSEVGR